MGLTRVYWQQGLRDPIWNDLITRKKRVGLGNVPDLRVKCDFNTVQYQPIIALPPLGLVPDPS